MIYQLAFDTFIGARAENQDSILNIKIAEDVFVVGIADGMGGVMGEKMASNMAIDAIKDYVKSLSPEQFEGPNLKEILSSCYDIAGFCIRKAVEHQPEYQGMGTTLSLLIICGDMYVWSNIGDSRIYVIRDGEMELITVDHTLVQQLSDQDGAELADASNSNWDHILTKCLDGSGELPDIFPLEKDYETLSGEMRFMLCSDGLILDKSESDQSKLKQIITKNGKVQDAVTDLISHAYTRGSKDNISVGVVYIHDNPAHESWDKLQKKRKWLRVYYGFIYFVLACLVIFAGWTFVDSLRTEGGFFDGKYQDGVDKQEDFSQKWLPMGDQSDIQMIPVSEELNWYPYPDSGIIRYYYVSIISEDRVVLEKYYKNNQTNLTYSRIGLEEGKQYTVIVDAITQNNERIEGNSMDFIIKNDQIIE